MNRGGMSMTMRNLDGYCVLVLPLAKRRAGFADDVSSDRIWLMPVRVFEGRVLLIFVNPKALKNIAASPALVGNNIASKDSVTCTPKRIDSVRLRSSVVNMNSRRVRNLYEIGWSEICDREGGKIRWRASCASMTNRMCWHHWRKCCGPLGTAPLLPCPGTKDFVYCFRTRWILSCWITRCQL